MGGSKSEARLMYENFKQENDLLDIEDGHCEIDSDDYVPSPDFDSKSRKEGKRKSGVGTKRKMSSEEDYFLIKLINAVYEREPLWNSTLPHEKRGYKHLSSLWNEVDELLKLNCGESQTKFKSLRDRFVRIAGEQRQQKENGSVEPPQWKYYEHLKFLQPTIIFRSSNVSVAKKLEKSSSSPAQKLSKTSDGSETSKTKVRRIEESFQAIAKKRETPDTTVDAEMTPFERYCIKQLALLNKPSDKISTFCSYLEAELRSLSDQKVENVKENILYLLLQAKKGTIK